MISSVISGCEIMKSPSELDIPNSAISRARVRSVRDQSAQNRATPMRVTRFLQPNEGKQALIRIRDLVKLGEILGSIQLIKCWIAQQCLGARGVSKTRLT